MLERAGPAARLLYGTPEYEVIVRGTWVPCAVTGERIPLHDLKYWSVAYQEAYRGAEEATAAAEAGGAKNLRKE